MSRTIEGANQGQMVSGDWARLDGSADVGGSQQMQQGEAFAQTVSVHIVPACDSSVNQAPKEAKPIKCEIQ